MHHSVTDPVFVGLLVAHVMTAVVGYGALFATGAYARALRTLADPYRSRAIERFFRRGPNLAARAVVLVPIFGAALVWTEGDLTSPAGFVWIGLGIWLASVTVCGSVIWPAESAAQQLLAAGPAEKAELLRAARRIEVGAALTAALFLAALVVMIRQP